MHLPIAEMGNESLNEGSSWRCKMNDFDFLKTERKFLVVCQMNEEYYWNKTSESVRIFLLII